jgi:hypothetical protein
MMTDSARIMRRHWRAWPTAARTAAAVIAAATLALLAACSGSPSSSGSPNAGGSASSPSAVAYSDCMRSHGVPDFTDPPSGGGIPKGSAQQFGVSTSQFTAAVAACAHLVPATGGSIQLCETTGECPQAVVQQALNIMRRYARCIRSHGVPNFPDPTVDSQGRPGFNLVPIHRTDWNSPQIQNQIYECEHMMPPGGGVPAIYPGGPG